MISWLCGWFSGPDWHRFLSGLVKALMVALFLTNAIRFCALEQCISSKHLLLLFIHQRCKSLRSAWMTLCYVSGKEPEDRVSKDCVHAATATTSGTTRLCVGNRRSNQIQLPHCLLNPARCCRQISQTCSTWRGLGASTKSPSLIKLNYQHDCCRLWGTVGCGKEQKSSPTSSDWSIFLCSI